MTKFEIEYKNGRGKFAVDLEQLLHAALVILKDFYLL